MKTNKVQQLLFELMKEASFNNFDGEEVVKSLEANTDLWESAMLDREGFADDGYTHCGSLSIGWIKLRDVKDGYWNVDALFIVPKRGKEAELEKLAKTWMADEINYINATHLGKVLRVWWD